MILLRKLFNVLTTSSVIAGQLIAPAFVFSLPSSVINRIESVTNTYQKNVTETEQSLALFSSNVRTNETLVIPPQQQKTTVSQQQITTSRPQSYHLVAALSDVLDTARNKLGTFLGNLFNSNESVFQSAAPAIPPQLTPSTSSGKATTPTETSEQAVAKSITPTQQPITNSQQPIPTNKISLTPEQELVELQNLFVQVQSAFPAVEQSLVPSGGSSLSFGQLQQKLESLEKKQAYDYQGLYNIASMSNRINEIKNVTITSPTFAANSITDADVPDSITASSYLSLSGGSLTGALGVGTSTPSNQLSVNGNTLISGTSTTGTLVVSSSTALFNGVTYIFPANNGDTDQRLTTNGAGVLSWETVTSGGGGGISTWNFGQGFLYNATTTDDVLVGASATSTTAKLEVHGTGYFAGDINLSGGDFRLSSGLSTTTFSMSGGNVAIASSTASSTPWANFSVEMFNNASPAFVVSDEGTSTPQFIVTNSGSVGIATTTPWANFSVEMFNNASPAFVVSDTGTSTPQFIVTNSGKIGFSTTTPWANVSVEVTNNNSPSFVIADEGTSTPQFIVTNSGRIGIGTTSPWGLLSIEIQPVIPSLVVGDEGTSSPRLIVTNNGVGIGTSTPNEALTVFGNISNLRSSTTPGAAFASSTMPLLVGWLSGYGNAEDIFVQGNVAYFLDGGNDLVVSVDVSDPKYPKELDSVSVTTGTLEMYVSGQYAYTTGDAILMNVVDISRPSDLRVVGTYLQGRSREIVVSGRYAFVWDIGTTVVNVLDVSDPTHIQGISSFAADGSINDMFISGNYLFMIGEADDDLDIFDISNPRNVKFMSTTNIGAGPEEIYVSGRYVYIVDSGDDDIKIYDIDNPLVPAKIGDLNFQAGFPFALQVSGRYAYVLDQDTNMFMTVDVASSTNPVYVGGVRVAHSGTVGDPENIAISGRYAYITDTGFDSIYIYDIGGFETVSANIHSLEAGNVQIRNDLTLRGHLQVLSSLTVGGMGILSAGPLGISATTTQSSILGGLFVGTSTPANSSPNSISFAQSVMVIEATSTAAIPLTIRGAGTQVGHFFRVQNSSNTNQLVFDANSRLGIGTTTPLSTEISATTAATTTMYLDTTATNRGTCIQIVSASGSVYRMYIGVGDIGTTTRAQNTGSPNGAIMAFWEFGSCK